MSPDALDLVETLPARGAGLSALRYVALSTAAVRAVQAGGPDAHGQPAEHHISDGGGNPCRHCLEDIAAGEEMLILAWRPFDGAQPYAETGPIFLHARPCRRHDEKAGTPPVVKSRPAFMMRAYGADGRIRYGTGGLVETPALEARALDLLADRETAWVDLRSRGYGCFQCRLERA
ncbi:DUF1203 domain-containing protein [Radicibacter daui]|uniref:DUF1203 domain-containing protein n=1 Tax=Radicibacter daui TaxID=3064829 RepID=UPI004046F3F7